MEKFPTSTQDVTTALSAAPLSEEDVVAFNATKPPVPLAALYLDPAPTALDYPFAIMPEVDPQKAKAAEALHTALRGPSFGKALAAAQPAQPRRLGRHRLRRARGRAPGGRAGRAGLARRRRGGRARRPVHRRDQPGARQLDGDHAAGPGPRRLRRVRLDADEGADRRQPHP
nr:hypothetical protein GCM10020092_061590 [Actinoplanes digitatis]